MRAVAVTRFGGPEVLEVQDIDEPHAGPGEIRISVEAASVVPADGLFRSGALAARLSTPAPWVPGTEVSGTVDEAPDGGPWQIGDEVVAIVVPWHQRRGAYAAKVVVPSASAASHPRSADLMSAATLPMSGLTASALLDLLDLGPGQTLAVVGAGGVVGGFLVQLARRAGATVMGDGGDCDVALRRDADYVEQIRETAPDGVDALVDAAVIGESLAAAVRDGGRLASLRATSAIPGRDISVVGISVWDYATDSARLAMLSALVDRGELHLPAIQTFSPDEAPAAHERLSARRQRARGVLAF